MNELKFKTNIKCGACEAAVKPKLDNLENTTWAVDLKHPDRILTVKGDTDSQAVVDALKEAGYKGEPV
ncbi:cation transporter [Litoribacter ruber]|uniref:Cation transporter n=1 Tax=Litoribacter ruber TaxID=702568 RepID=A0AAP2G4Q0_9BACT|nr:MULTISPECIES: cation transporter [Litoribacter]MBS9523688.1 cation transporter [Litoribacter alkaliphilus]MBT0812202.1 cation transporter [Litoribacter ruber]